MKYFRNVEIAKLYNVSEKSVRNWIASARSGKLDLQVFEEKGKLYVANTSKNVHVIEQLAQKGKKYKNTLAAKSVHPLPQLYTLCTTQQISDLISNIDTHREIPHQYSYLDGGANYWDQYAHKLHVEKTSNSIKNTIQLFELNMDYILALTEGHKAVNVVDIGVGNSLPVRGLLQKLFDKGTLRRYIGIDISSDMLKIAERNIHEWFNGNIHFEGCVKDINYDRFGDLLVADSYGKDDDSVINLVLFLGGTISNLRDPGQALRIINNSIGKNDIFIVSRKLDTEATRRFFDFNALPNDQTLNIKEKNMLDLLGIDESFYTVEQLFDEDRMARIMKVRLKFDLTIKFKLGSNTKDVDILKDESVTIWRSDHQRLQDTVRQLGNNGFDVIQATKSIDQQYLLTISKLKTVR